MSDILDTFLPGQLEVEKITLANAEGEAIDFTNTTSNIRLTESIHQPFVSGSISVVDGNDMLKYYKMTGQESLTINVRPVDADENGQAILAKPEQSINRVFRVYSITKEIPADNDQSKGYIMSFIDPKSFLASQTRISQCLRGSYSDMLIKVWREYLFSEKDDVDKLTEYWDKSTPSNHQLVVPNWTINKLIKYICENADEGPEATWHNSMFFFDTVFGKQRFMSYDNMMKMECPVAFDSYSRKSVLGTEAFNPNLPLIGLNTQILEYSRPKRTNTLKGANSGAYSSRINSYDPVKKVNRVQIFSLQDVYDRMDGKFPLVRLGEDEVIYEAGTIPEFVSEPIETTSVYVTPPLDGEIASHNLTLNKVNATNDYSDSAYLLDSTDQVEIAQDWVGEEHKDNGLLERISLLSLLDNYVTEVVIPFRPDIYSGMAVTLHIPSVELMPSSGESPPKDEMNNDNYLVTGVVFDLKPSKGFGHIRMRCVKDSSAVDIKSYQPLAKDTSTPEKL
tara:strand:- start:2777 stop:4297 length:1521 start_codon:yes stop_codon:yes gene_type:complete